MCRPITRPHSRLHGDDDSDAGGVRQSFEIRGSDSYLSSNDLRAQIGLAHSKQADIEIHWPGGQVDKYSKVAATKFYLAREGDSLRVDPRVKPLHKKSNY